MSQPIASVVVPAHDEGPRIAATLGTLLADAAPGEFEVVVVCNGCRDDTAERAREFDGVIVEELSEPSKIGALRHGDDVATTFPRIYLDGDVELSTPAARALATALDTPLPRVAGVRGRVDASGSTRGARWYFDFRRRLPVFHHGIIGAGVYALNEPGRARFGTWPDILGDDQFVFRLFTDDERVTVDGHRTHVEAAPDLATVVRRQVRVRRGNTQLTTGTDDLAAIQAPPAGIARAVREVAPDPSAWPGLVTWGVVNLVVRARTRLTASTGDWTTGRGGGDAPD